MSKNHLNFKSRQKAWKNEVKKAILEANEKELKMEIINFKKFKNTETLSEEFGIKQYIKELTVYEARNLFKHRSKMTQYIKMNYKNDPIYAKKLWKCDDCGKMDSESHLMWCEAYEKWSENKNLNNNKDLCKYLHDILKHRTKKDLKKRKENTDEAESAVEI
jgi:hypothetical protein